MPDSITRDIVRNIPGTTYKGTFTVTITTHGALHEVIFLTINRHDGCGEVTVCDADRTRHEYVFRLLWESYPFRAAVEHEVRNEPWPTHKLSVFPNSVTGQHEWIRQKDWVRD